MEEGLGDRRAALREKSFSADWGEDTAAIMSHTLAKVHLRRASRADVLQYFFNTWDLTDQLFSGASICFFVLCWVWVRLVCLLHAYVCVCVLAVDRCHFRCQVSAAVRACFQCAFPPDF